MPPTCTEAWSIRQVTTHMHKDRCDTSGTCVQSLLVKLKTIVHAITGKSAKEDENRDWDTWQAQPQ